MKPERWQQIDQILEAALERERNERAAFLDQACAGDEELRREVESLLRAHDQAGSFIEKLPPEAAEEILADHQSESLIGKQVGSYRIERLLGKGGMGEVYLATDKMGRQVALKLLASRLDRHPQHVARFQQEARTILALNHPNIVTIHDIGETNGTYYFASELIEGETLRLHLERGEVEMHSALEIAIQVATALSYAHERGIVHRDIKPENVMLRSDGYVKVLDFGIAKLTEEFAHASSTEAATRLKVETAEGVVIGTAAYMSPEQAKGTKVDARTDLWSLGAIVYEMVSGYLPFAGETPTETISLILQKGPAPLSRYTHEAPAELERIVTKALTKDREQRYQTAKDLLIDLRNLKRKLEVDAEIDRTVPPEFRAATSTNSQSMPATASGSATTSPTTPSVSGAEYIVTEVKQHKLAAAIAIIALVLGAVGLIAYLHARNTEAEIKSIAVLPFDNQNRDPNTEYLSDGISESLINSLSQMPGMKVIARSSSFKYKGKEVDPQEAARALGVEAILTGRVAQRGENLLIGVELVDARDKTQVWGEQYNRKAIDLLAVQSEISGEIAEALRLRLTSKDQRRLTKRPTQNSEAYQLYLNGLFHDRKKEAESLNRALDYYHQAIALDPNFALAYAGMSSTYTFLAEASVLEAKEALSRSKAAAMKALELDEALAEAHWALANIKANEWDWAGAENQYKRAIELSPSLAVAHYDYAYYLVCLERYSEALTEIKRAQELDPLNAHFRATEGFILLFARRYDEAIQQLQSVIKTEPDSPAGHVFLGYTYASKGLYPEAIAEYQAFFSLEKESTSAECYLGYAYAMSGKRREALAVLQKLMTTKEYVSPAELAVLYAGLGNKEEALGLLEKAYEAHDLQLRHLKVDPHYDSLRTDPRFSGLVRRVGFAS